jgi:Cu2+-exporting ATPase
VFDKTGTLTSAMMSVSRCRAKGPLSEQDCLEIAAALEVASEHPIARAFASTPGRRLDAGDMQVVPGAGITGMVEGKRYQIGTRAFVAGFLAGRVPVDDDATIVLTGEGVELATFELQDTPRPEGPGAVRELLEQGLSTEILSGDSFAAVSRLAGHCGISAYSARQSPADKLERVKALSQRGEFIAMVGDGINDAPVLGGAGLSVAMSRGSALALASADLVLIGDSLRALPGAFLLARRARRIMRQNLVWAAAYNLVAMPLAALGWVPPWAAAIGMSLSSILVVLNSVRLMRDSRSRGGEPRRGRAPLSVPPIGTPPAAGAAMS